MGRVVAVVMALAALAAAPAAHAGAETAALQAALFAEGLYRSSVDGLPGPATTAALVSFQRRAGLPADGLIGPLTRRALGRRGRPRYGSRLIVSGDRGWDVAALQFELARHGFPSGTVDGGFGARTQDAVLRFQRWAGLPATGQAGPLTRRALQAPPPRCPLALAWPVRAPVGDRFGPRGDRFHAGLDLPAATGVPVTAAGAGTVSWAGPLDGWGNLVVIDHGGDVQTAYAHLSVIAVRGGQAVAAGTLVGRVGMTGHATGPHLHFEVRLRGAYVDPLGCLP
jgi:murein DD-endopeptidase MepM/ murein hydrolase activator NlpD